MSSYPSALPERIAKVRFARNAKAQTKAAAQRFSARMASTIFMVSTLSTLADLYDPDVMPQNFRKAHWALDEAVDRLYRKEPFVSDREGVEHLFGLYEKLTAPMLAAAGPISLKTPITRPMLSAVPMSVNLRPTWSGRCASGPQVHGSIF